MQPHPTAGARRWLIHGLGLYVLVMYGITYYAVSTAAPRIAEEFQVSTSLVFAIFSGALLLTAMLAPRYGRWTDRHGSGAVLVLGATLRATALVAMAMAPELWSFIAAFVAVQLLSQVTEYDATFAAAVEVSGANARAGMGQITLWGGLASTAFWPATAFLLEQTTWRTTLLLYAALMLAVCVPVALALLRSPRPADDDMAKARAENDAASATVFLPSPDARFMLLAVAFAAGGVAYNLPLLMLPVLQGLGLGAGAVVVGMIFGPSQTAGRLFELLLGQRMHPLGVSVIAAATMTMSLVILMLDLGIWAAMVFAILFGTGAGVGYVVRGSIVLALYGNAHFAGWLGRLAAVRLVISATAPFVLSMILERFGAWSVVAFCATAATLSLLCFAILERKGRGELSAEPI